MSTVKSKFQTIIRHIAGTDSIAGINISAMFQPDGTDDISIAKSLNASFLIVLSGESHPLFNQAQAYISELQTRPAWTQTATFYNEAPGRICDEISDGCTANTVLKESLKDLYQWITTPDIRKSRHETIEKIRALFFPEGVGLCDNREFIIEELRRKRVVNITQLNESPLSDPAREIVFTSNVLITVPPTGKDIKDLPVRDSLKQKLRNITTEKQRYWYDHPIPVGVEPEHNEIIYGLSALDDAVEFEKQQGNIDSDTRITCVLSVSVTHEGLKGIAKDYIEDELRKEKTIRHLDVYVFTEDDTANIVNDILCRASGSDQSPANAVSALREVFGVDGEYGRHYSFLKAIAAFWQVLIDRSVRGTFKIDLDQVFPQKNLLKESGHTAFSHFKTPLWGAEGIDSEGSEVELGMIAGALVNEKDVGNSLFTPDVCFPPDRGQGDKLVFFSTLPQALSTEAEMMTRYAENSIDGKSGCIQRIHVTGGTCGILIDALRKYRPFTPTFIGRAEDQAYILSVLFSGDRKLRYVHKDGLIMRHDKEAFASEAIQMAATGKLIGDYVRTLMFSYYARALPWSFDRIKKTIDPFTGCFASKTPLTVVYLRFALKAATFFADEGEGQQNKGLEFINAGIDRLGKTIEHLTKDPDLLASQYNREKQGWNFFYDILDRIEAEIEDGDTAALSLKQKALDLISNCKINFNDNGQ